MASKGKRKTTMAKLNRESRLRERRRDKEARKLARKLESPLSPDPDDTVVLEERRDVAHEGERPVGSGPAAGDIAHPDTE